MLPYEFRTPGFSSDFLVPWVGGKSLYISFYTRYSPTSVGEEGEGRRG